VKQLLNPVPLLVNFPILHLFCQNGSLSEQFFLLLGNSLLLLDGATREEP